MGYINKKEKTIREEEKKRIIVRNWILIRIQNLKSNLKEYNLIIIRRSNNNNNNNSNSNNSSN